MNNWSGPCSGLWSGLVWTLAWSTGLTRHNIYMYGVQDMVTELANLQFRSVSQSRSSVQEMLAHLKKLQPQMYKISIIGNYRHPWGESGEWSGDPARPDGRNATCQKRLLCREGEAPCHAPSPWHGLCRAT